MKKSSKENTGTHLVLNPFEKAMDSSVDNAATISASVLNALYNARLSDTRILALYNYYLALDTPVQDAAIAQAAGMVERVAATKAVVDTVEGMQPYVHAIFLGIENVYPKGSPNYNRLLIGGTEGFYKHSRNAKVTRLNALVAAIGSDGSLAAVKILVQNLATNLGGNITSQSTEKTNVKTDAANVKSDIAAATKGLWYVYFGLMMVYITNVALAIAFFPMEFIYKAAKQTIKTVYVPKATIKKILSHLFKVGETFTAKNNGTVDLYIGLAQTATSDVLVWYLLPAGATVTDIAYSLLGNPTFKFVMTKNASLTTAGDLTFTVNGI